jgi:hypothetical protein
LRSIVTWISRRFEMPVSRSGSLALRTRTKICSEPFFGKLDVG